MKLGLLPIDAVVTQRKASMDQSRLLKLRLLPWEAAASPDKDLLWRLMLARPWVFWSARPLVLVNGTTTVAVTFSS